jgi:hypothetical protein
MSCTERRFTYVQAQVGLPASSLTTPTVSWGVRYLLSKFLALLVPGKPPSNTSTLWQDHVFVAQAEGDFSRVEQSLQTPRVAEKVVQRDSGSTDLEKGHDEERQETFDLREYLTSSNDANSAAGIKHKHVVVTWEDLEVLGIGGQGNKVCHITHTPSVFPASFFIFNRSMCPHTPVNIFCPFHMNFPDLLGRRGCRTDHLPFRCPPQCAPANPTKETVTTATCSNDHS